MKFDEMGLMSGKFSAWLQSKLVVPLLTSFTKGEKKKYAIPVRKAIDEFMEGKRCKRCF